MIYLSIYIFIYQSIYLGYWRDDRHEVLLQDVLPFLSLPIYLSIYLSIFFKKNIGLIEAIYSTCIVVFHLNTLTWFSWCTIVQCTLTKVFWLNWDLELLQVRGSFWNKGIQQRGMIQQKVLTAGHPTLYFCYKSKPLFNT